MTAVVIGLIVALVLSLSLNFVLLTPTPGEGGHFEGRNPQADEIERALTASKKELRQSIAPWAHRSPVPDYRRKTSQN